MSEQWIPGSKKDLMAAIEREWKRLMDLAESLTEAQMTRPDAGGWSPRDNLSHLAEWMRVLMGYHIDRRPSHEVLGVPESVVEGWDMEAINPVLFERNRGRPTAEVLEGLRQTYRQLAARLDAMTFEEMLQPRHADDPEKRPLLMWILGDTSEHFEEHRRTIEQAIRG